MAAVDSTGHSAGRRASSGVAAYYAVGNRWAAVIVAPNSGADIIAYRTICNHWVAVILTVDSSGVLAVRVARHYTVSNRWAAIVATYCAASIGNCKAGKYGIGIFAAFEAKGGIRAKVVAVNNCCGDYVGVFRSDALDGDIFALETNLDVSRAGVCSGKDKDIIAIGGIVDCGLDVIEIVGPIVIDDDYFSGAGDG